MTDIGRFHRTSGCCDRLVSEPLVWHCGRIVWGRPELSSFSRAYIGYAGREGFAVGYAGREGFAVRFSNMSFMVHCDFEKWYQNKTIQSNLLVGREGGHKKYTQSTLLIMLTVVDEQPLRN